MILLGLAILLSPTIFISLYLWKKKHWMLITSLITGLVLIFSIFGMVSNHNEEITAEQNHSYQLKGVMDRYFFCMEHSENIDDIVNCNSAFRQAYDYYTNESIISN